jgi:uncharacterized protein YabN with tetrapyrrole methylase and pyrophosphatase domain
MTLDELYKKTLDWSYDRGILTNGNSMTQTLKLMSEMGELCDNIAKGKDVKDDIGDCLVVLANIASLSNTNLVECWTHAYNDIKDRKGFLNADGIFIKESDPAYKQLKLEFEKDEK